MQTWCLHRYRGGEREVYGRDTSWPLTAVRISFYSEGVGDEVVKHEQKMAHSGLCFNKS